MLHLSLANSQVKTISVHPYVYNPDDHRELFSKLLEIGNGSLKSGDFNKRAMEIIKEYSENLGSDFIEFVTNGDSLKMENPWNPSGKVIRRFLGNLGMVVDTKQKRVDGGRDEYAVLTTRHYIIAKSIGDDSAMDSNVSEQVKLAREIIQQLKIEE